MDLKNELFAYRDKATSLVRKEGVSPDLVLTNELANPGSDTRSGLSFICWPNEKLLEHISSLQNYLKALEPNQYYYPKTDLHLTMLEIRFNEPLKVVEDLAQKISSIGANIFCDLKAPIIEPYTLVTDPKGLALNLLPDTDNQNQLEILRKTIVERLNQNGFVIKPRYEAKFGHITLMRYLNQIKDIGSWLHAIDTAPINQSISWTLDSLYLSWGADWYCMLNRNTQFGPYTLAITPHP
jgi:2'-5' RNA ligase